MLDVHRLVLLREVHLRGSIAAAARSLSYSHSAVSQQIALLEKEVGVPLLERLGRGVLLTPAARELVGHTDEVLAVLERARARLAAADSAVRGTITVASISTVSRAVMPEALTRLAERYPDLEVRFHQLEPEEGIARLAARAVDVFVTDGFPGTPETGSPDVYADLLAMDPVRPYLPAHIPVESVDDLRRIPWVLEPLGTASHEWVVRTCRERGFDPLVRYESADLLFHLRMVERGLAASFLPDLVVREADTRLTPSAVLPSDRERSIHLMCRSGAESHPAIDACRATLRECFAL